jgi:hypothetical protein
MPIPEFTAKAALYPTANHYRTLDRGPAEPAHEVTAHPTCRATWNAEPRLTQEEQEDF